MAGDLVVDQDCLNVVSAHRKLLMYIVNGHFSSDRLVLDHSGTVKINGDPSDNISP